MLLLVLTTLALVHITEQFYYMKKTRLSLDFDDKDVNNDEGIVKLVPFHALVVHGHGFCSGALIASRIVLTVATCVQKDESQILVKLGSGSTSGDGQVINVIDVKIHEYHRHRSALDNDIALLVLANHVLYGQRVSKIILSYPDAALEDNSIFYVSNFDQKTNFTKATHDLQITEMIMYSPQECNEKYGRIITPALFCGFGLNMLGDIGGAALFDKYAVGLTVYMGNRSDSNPIAIFANISYFHSVNKWIKLKKMLCYQHCCRSLELISLVTFCTPTGFQLWRLQICQLYSTAYWRKIVTGGYN